jgi:hypothetical protein
MQSPEDESVAQTPAEQAVIELFDQPCLAVRDQRGAIYVVVTDLCAALGIKADAQLRRIRQHEQLRAGLATFRVRQGNRIVSVACLHLQLTAGWLMQISTARVREEVRERLRFLQLHLFDTVWRAFAALAGLPAQVEQIEDVQDVDRLDRALRTLEELAGRQAAIEQSQDRARESWRQMSERLRELSGRIAELEQRVGGKLSPGQRGHLYHLVQAWGAARAERAPTMSKSALFAACWAELKVRFNVARYEDLSPAQYAEAVSYVRQQYRALTGGELDLPAQDELPL